MLHVEQAKSVRKGTPRKGTPLQGERPEKGLASVSEREGAGRRLGWWTTLGKIRGAMQNLKNFGRSVKSWMRAERSNTSSSAELSGAGVNPVRGGSSQPATLRQRGDSVSAGGAIPGAESQVRAFWLPTPRLVPFQAPA